MRDSISIVHLNGKATSNVPHCSETETRNSQHYFRFDGVAVAHYCKSFSASAATAGKKMFLPFRQLRGR